MAKRWSQRKTVKAKISPDAVFLSVEGFISIWEGEGKRKMEGKIKENGRKWGKVGKEIQGG